MANDKLQELTQQLYQEGLAKGKAEGERILAEAREEAARILNEASTKAEDLVNDAKVRAEDLTAKAESDIRAACNQALQATRNDIQNAIMARVVDQGCKKVLSNEDFLKEIIMAVAKAFSLQSTAELRMILPEKIGISLHDFVSREVSSAIGRKIDVTLSKDIGSGIIVEPQGEGYRISLSDGTFSSLIREYLRPVTKKVLFGE